MLEKTINVLLVEDDPTDIELIKKMLEAFGAGTFSLKLATTLSEGISTLSKDKIDVLLLDLTLPDSPQEKTLRWMKNQKMPIIIITGQDDRDFIINALQWGAQDYLIKSDFNSDLLRHSLIYSYERWQANHIIIEQLLKDSEDRFKNIFDEMNFGIAIYEPVKDCSDFIIKGINRAGEVISNVKKEAIIGHKLLDVFPGVKELGLFDVLKEVCQTGEPAHHPVALYRDERLTHWTENYVYKLSAGEVVAIYNDATEEKKAEEETKNNLRELQQFKDVIIDRELIVIELKKTVNALSKELGRDAPYDLSFEDNPL